MRNLGIFLALVFSAASFAEYKLEPIGEEVILSSEYPKVLFFGKVNSGRRVGIAGKDLSIPFSPSVGGGMLIDVGLFEYFSAGAMFFGDYSSHPVHGFESFSTTLDFFARPKISFFDCLTLYSRLGIGASVLMGIPAILFKNNATGNASSIIATEFSSPHYGFAHPGVNASASIGVEYFPIPRIGLSFEAGISSTYYHVTKSDIMREVARDLGGHSLEDGAKPFWLSSLEIPIMLSLNIIL